MDLNIQQMLFEFFGGLGIFLFGIKLMGDGLQNSAGDKLKYLLDKFTTNPLMGVLAGIFVTVIIQSSSATTVITVGLVSAGFMTLRQAIGVIMGANIGTTITAFIIGIDVGEYSLPILAAGAVFLFFFKKRKQLTYLGQVLFGFGALFYGLELMSNGMKPLRTLEAFHDLTVDLSANPFLGVIVGTLFTVLVQSSSATIGILQSMYAESLLDLNAALPVLFGDNIGTTITAVLASIGTSIAAKRAAATHVLFNVFGTTLFLILLVPFTSLIQSLQSMLHLNPEMAIAFAHGIFNSTNTLLLLPFVSVLAFIVTKLIPGKDTLWSFQPKHLNPIFIEQSPTIALGQAKEEVLHMGEMAVSGLTETKRFIDTKQAKFANSMYQLETAINHLDQTITEYLIKLSSASLSVKKSEEHSILLDTVRNIERIGDHCENMLELIEFQMANKVNLTDSAKKDLDEMYEMTISIVKEALTALKGNNKDIARQVIEKETMIDVMEQQFRKQHILRLTDGTCTPKAGVVFIDIINNLERIADHAVNIADAVLGEHH
ncbi:Na/Pi cotransporter family protein [Niallia endozanthoxylica]|uniref:Na/Pi cotransporter family protein n=1 Tax=Niallia endozanthoxylica TaxID=2036016 RepID=A0A5J5I6Z9_9BACI|nr:Na/Pi cotransporter family protein [Niallia endozanthoxylica]KAA9031590.1 Na/Pi cotransporter family protein [Niallia endozanthoxylica]